MTLAELKAIVASIGIPCAYGFFPQAQAPPYIVFAETYRNPIYADGVVIYAEPSILLRFYSQTRDLTTERLIEATLATHKIAYDTPDYEYDEDQGVHIASYYFAI